jgi:hypothetical protein
MKKPICLFLILAVTITACYKTTVTVQSSDFSATVDGDTVSFKWVGVDSTAGYLGISAAKDSSSASPYFSLYIYHNGPLTTGAYPVASPFGAASELDYFEFPGGVLTEYHSTNAVVNITAITGSSITGNFLGTCYLDLNDPSSINLNLDPTHSRVVTNGKFTIRRH